MPDSPFQKGADAYRAFVRKMSTYNDWVDNRPPPQPEVPPPVPASKKRDAEAMSKISKTDRLGLVEAYRQMGKPVPECLLWTKEQRRTIMEG
jgi:hypothetical protein